jgi:cytochrome c biogenesis protein CcdA/glutaredoxin
MRLSLLFIFSLLLFPLSFSQCIYYFYSAACPHCARVTPLIENLSERYGIELKKFNIDDPSSYSSFDFLCDKYCVTVRGVPTVFIGDKVLIGDKIIEQNLEKEILNCKKYGCPCPESIENISANVTVSGAITQISKEKIESIDLIALISAALVDSINPCAFAVLIFFCAYTLSIGSGKKMLFLGMLYIFVVFVAYTLSGFGIFSVIQTVKNIIIIRNVVVLICIVGGAINIKDFFFYGKWVSLEIPKSMKPKIESLIASATPIAAIALGILVSIVELPCTGGPYLAILTMLSEKLTLMKAIPYLLLYNLIFILPLILILGLAYLGYSLQKVERIRRKRRNWMRLFAGIIMIALGILLFLRVI